MEQELEVLEPVEQAPEPVPVQKAPKVLSYWNRPRVKWTIRIISGLAASALIILFILYFKYARMIDRRLEDGPFSTATGIYTSPRPVSVGDGIASDQVVERLRRSGYTTTRDNPAGWFVVWPTAIEIHPGEDSVTGTDSVRIEFANGKIARITGLRDRGLRKDYLLDPQLIANVSGDREKRVFVRFHDIPKSLIMRSYQLKINAFSATPASIPCGF